MSRLPIVDGRRFGCTRCGNCCEQDGMVFMTPPEVERIAAYLELPPNVFRTRYRVLPEYGTDYERMEAKEGRGCPLLDETRSCSVHAVKPAQCATWPFWPDMLDEASAWEAAKSYCPGLDAPSGKLYGPEEITQIAACERGT